MALSVYRAKTVAFCLLFAILSAGLLASAAVAAPLLKEGMTGSSVKELQQRLTEWGHPVKADGHFGPLTKAAVKAFQKDRGLAVDGIVGNQTWRELNKSPAQIHLVKRGDSLYVLARRYGVSIADIMEANNLSSEVIVVGQKLSIPKKAAAEAAAGGGAAEAASSGQVYQVRPGDSASVIAKKFNTSVPALAEANRLSDPNRLRAGQELIIPGWQASIPRMIWPVKGRVSSPYGWRIHPVYKNRQFHGGIDIAVPVGTSVKAAAAGKVIESGWMDGFGYGVVIDHGQGVTTWYGHNSKLLVKAGDRVRQGQVIARSGNTGVSTGPHVDFRIKVNGETLNPVYWLP
ncbi:MAG: peptidoglycan DD-metalloendopeptidase family protein [Firmicutes bacterium]|nr:peptidoglycan DD-metalloendopeptidase family protein [Bacillota bacterium]